MAIDIRTLDAALLAVAIVAAVAGWALGMLLSRHMPSVHRGRK